MPPQKVSGELLAWKGENDLIAELCSWFRGTAGEVGNFLDVGANIGSFTIPMADCLRFRGGRVIAVEGMPPIADHLAVGILANNLQNVDMYMYAVSASDDPKQVNMSLNPVNKELYEVPLTTGDRMLASNSALKAIMIAKVGIEGQEGHFLKGSQRLFSQYPPCIMTIELNPEWLERAGTPVEEILVRLDSWGYSGVPTAAHLRASNTQGKTRLITQRNLTACLERVKTFAAESNVQPQINYSDPNALSAVLAREARAKELEAMLVHDPRPKGWWRNARR
jgi:FkbM family methyltransferase